MLKAIETTYQGYRFRSRIEARWAVFMDKLAIAYDYEPEGYVLPHVGPYLPDFWLPEMRCWIEIKGMYPNAIEIEKACLLAEHDGRPVLIFHGAIEPGIRAGFAHPDGRFFPNVYAWGQCVKCDHIDIIDIDAYRHIQCPICATHRLYRLTSPALRAAYDTARGARFKHGVHHG